MFEKYNNKEHRSRKSDTAYLKILICALILLLIPLRNVFGDTKELTIDINNDYTNAAFSVTWENDEKEADVELVSPEGTKYSKADTPDDVYEARGEVVIRVGQPAKGQWKINVTGDNLGVIDVNVGQIPNSLIIDSFTVDKNGDKYEASYAVSDCPENIDIEVFADTDSEGFDGVRVYSGYGSAAGTVELNMASLAAGEYHFYIRISVDGIYKRQYSDSVISYENPDITEKVEGVAGGKYNDGYYIEWDYENEYDKFTVYVWDGELNLKLAQDIEGEGFYYGEFEQDEEKVYLAVVYSNYRSNYDKIEVDYDTELAAEVTFDVEEEVTARKYISGKVAFDGDCEIDAYLNGEQKLEGETEQGTYRITMSDGDNEVIFLVTDEDGNKAEFVKNIYVDTVPPALSVTEDINQLTTSKGYVYISGYSESGAKLTLNGREIEMQQGYFNEKLNLDSGKNKVELIAEDIAGNRSVYTAVVNQKASKKSRLEWYIIIAVAAILFIVYLVVFVKGIKRREAK